MRRLTPWLPLVALAATLPLAAIPDRAQERPPSTPPATDVPAAAPAPTTTAGAQDAQAATEPAKAPKLVASETMREAGKVSRGDQITQEFELRNDGDADLAIRSVQPSCGCTVAAFDRKIEPGKTGKVKVVIHTDGFTGAIAKAVTVYSNDPATPRLVLTVKAEITAHVLAEPSYVRFVQTQTMAPETTGVTVWSPDDPKFAVTGADSTLSYVSAEVRPAADTEKVAEGTGPQWRVEVSLAADAPVGPLSDFVVLRTNHPQQATLQVPLSGVVRPVLHLSQEAARFGDISLAGQAREVVLTLINFGDQPVEVSSVHADTEGVSARAEVVESGKRWKIVVALAPSMPKGKIDAHLEIETTSPVIPELEVPVTGRIL
jgi:Protein of unknown function (DUF1573)